MKLIFTLLSSLAFAITSVTAAEADQAAIAATKTMHQLLEAGKFEEVYRDWCHPHLQKQMDAVKFAGWMKSEKGKKVIQLFADIIKAMDEKAGPEVVVAQPEEDKNQYEFILTGVKSRNPIGQKGSEWHLELEFHDGKWKFMDVD